MRTAVPTAAEPQRGTGFCAIPVLRGSLTHELACLHGSFVVGYVCVIYDCKSGSCVQVSMIFVVGDLLQVMALRSTTASHTARLSNPRNCRSLSSLSWHVSFERSLDL